MTAVKRVRRIFSVKEELLNLWKASDAKGASKGFGVPLAKTWYWYESWVDEVRTHCKENAGTYR